MTQDDYCCQTQLYSPFRCLSLTRANRQNREQCTVMQVQTTHGPLISYLGTVQAEMAMSTAPASMPRLDFPFFGGAANLDLAFRHARGPRGSSWRRRVDKAIVLALLWLITGKKQANHPTGSCNGEACLPVEAR